MPLAFMAMLWGVGEPLYKTQKKKKGNEETFHYANILNTTKKTISKARQQGIDCEKIFEVHQSDK